MDKEKLKKKYSNMEHGKLVNLLIKRDGELESLNKSLDYNREDSVKKEISIQELKSEVNTLENKIKYNGATPFNIIVQYYKENWCGERCKIVKNIPCYTYTLTEKENGYLVIINSDFKKDVIMLGDLISLEHYGKVIYNKSKGK